MSKFVHLFSGGESLAEMEFASGVACLVELIVDISVTLLSLFRMCFFPSYWRAHNAFASCPVHDCICSKTRFFCPSSSHSQSPLF
jgi:hypothetical protein